MLSFFIRGLEGCSRRKALLPLILGTVLWVSDVASGALTLPCPRMLSPRLAWSFHRPLNSDICPTTSPLLLLASTPPQRFVSYIPDNGIAFLILDTMLARWPTFTSILTPSAGHPPPQRRSTTCLPCNWMRSGLGKPAHFSAIQWLQLYLLQGLSPSLSERTPSLEVCLSLGSFPQP